MEARPSRRTEDRTPLQVSVTLLSMSVGTYEVTTTQDVSLHGASILTKQHWQPNQRIDVRSLQGSFSGFARVVHCRQKSPAAFITGLEFFFTNGQWTDGERRSSGAATA
jgi:PilZ domain